MVPVEGHDEAVYLLVRVHADLKPYLFRRLACCRYQPFIRVNGVVLRWKFPFNIGVQGAHIAQAHYNKNGHQPILLHTHASNSATSHTWSVIPASIAGVTRSDLLYPAKL